MTTTNTAAAAPANTRQAKIARFHETMKSLTIGFEIETVKLGKAGCASAIASVYPGSRIDTWNGTRVILADGRAWRCISDASIRGLAPCEVVSPILTYSDIDQAQQVVRALRRAGARVNASCGMHVHIGASKFKANPAALARLAKLTNQQEDLMVAAFGTSADRMARWTKPVEAAFLAKIDGIKKPSLQQIKDAWYASTGSAYGRYNDSRYRGLNLHAVFDKGTVEFRYFDGTLHAGKVKGYIQFCLALATKALLAHSARSSKRVVRNSNLKYAFRVFLIRLNLNGDEFKTCRLHLMALLPGSAAHSNKVAA